MGGRQLARKISFGRFIYGEMSCREAQGQAETLYPLSARRIHRAELP